MLNLINAPEYAYHYEFVVARKIDGDLWFGVPIPTVLRLTRSLMKWAESSSTMCGFRVISPESAPGQLCFKIQKGLLEFIKNS